MTFVQIIFYFYNCAVVILSLLLSFSSVAFAQRGQRSGATANPVPAPPHDPHDLNGLWLAQGGGARGGRGNAASEADSKGFLKDGGIMTQWGPSSPLTPAGLKVVNGKYVNIAK